MHQLQTPIGRQFFTRIFLISNRGKFIRDLIWVSSLFSMHIKMKELWVKSSYQKISRIRWIQIDCHGIRLNLLGIKFSSKVGVDLTLTCFFNSFLQPLGKFFLFLTHDVLFFIISAHKFPVPFYETKDCGLKSKSTSWSHQKKSTGTTMLLYFLSLILISLILALIYVQRSQLKHKLDPVIETVHKRVRYTSIATADGQEISVWSRSERHANNQKTNSII